MRRKGIIKRRIANLALIANHSLCGYLLLSEYFTKSYFGDEIVAPNGITFFINDNHGTYDNKGLKKEKFITFNGNDMEVAENTLVWQVNLDALSE